MKQLYTFDEVFDSQKVFRYMLDAMSNPGRRCMLSDESAKMFGDYPAMLTAAMTLLDGSVSFYAGGNEELEEAIVLLTHAKKQSMGEADYLFIPDHMEMKKVIAEAKCGTLESPHTSATVIIQIPDQDPACEISLQGPGVDGCLRLQVPVSLVQAVKLRDEQEYEYPQGIDLMFLLPGEELMCIPRLVKMEEY